jgi:hypothetical protein
MNTKNSFLGHDMTDHLIKPSFSLPQAALFVTEAEASCFNILSLNHSVYHEMVLISLTPLSFASQIV